MCPCRVIIVGVEKTERERKAIIVRLKSWRAFWDYFGEYLHTQRSGNTRHLACGRRGRKTDVAKIWREESCVWGHNNNILIMMHRRLAMGGWDWEETINNILMKHYNNGI